MVSKRSGGPVHPAVSARKFVRFVERITDTVVIARTFADHHQPDFLLSIVDERVADSGACRKPHRIALSNGVKHAVDPDIGLPLEHVHKLLLSTFGVRI